MKKITCLFILVFCLSLQMMAQVKKATTKSATAPTPNLEKMLKDLPADERAMVKEMMGNKTGSAIKKDETVKKVASPIIKIQLKQPLQVPTEAQAKDRLLWYKGKKMNDSMLVTTKAMVVLYSEKRNIVIAQPLDETDPFKEMAKNVSKEQKMVDDYIETEAAKPNGWMNYPLIQMTVDRFEAFYEQFNNAIKNTIDLPEEPHIRPATGQDKGVPPAKQDKNKPSTSGSKNCDDVNEKTKSVLQNQHEALKTLLNNPPDMSVDAPPKENFASMAFICDKSKVAKYNQEYKNWKKNAVGYEWSLINKAKSLGVTIQLSGSDNDCADKISPGLSADIEKSMKFGCSRLEEKITKLANSYGKDVFRQMDISLLAFEYKRQRQLMGIADPEEGLIADIAKQAGGPEFANYINEQIDKKNWDVALNVGWILVRSAMCNLMDAKGDQEGRLELLKRVILVNRFTIAVDIDFNERYHNDDGEDVLKVNGSIKTTDKVYASLFFASCDAWYLMRPLFDMSGKPLYIPMQVVGGLKSIKDDKSWVNYSYSGPKDMRMDFPFIQLDFTNTDVPDAFVLQRLRYEDGVPYIFKEYATAYTTDLTGYLNDVYMRPELTGANEQQVKDYGKAMMDRFSKITPIQSNTTTLEKLKSQHSIMVLKQEGARTASEIINTAFPLFDFNAQNGSSTLIDINVDTKHKNNYVEVIYGIFKVKVVHDPYPEFNAPPTK